MQEFFPDIEVRDDQAEAIARGLIAVAKADGVVHERERAMIAEFFASITDRVSDFGAFENFDDPEPEILAAQLPRKELRQLFLKTSLLLAYADGGYGEGEAVLIGKYAAAMEIEKEELDTLEALVKDYLLAQLSHLANIEAVAEVAKELDV